MKGSLLFGLILLSLTGLSQNLDYLDTLSVEGLIDTLLIDHNRSNWSFRLVSNHNVQRFSLSNEAQKLSFSPNNPYGIGLGIGTSKLIIDIVFNLKNKTVTPTKRFNIHGSFFVKNHLIDFQLQHYRGFNVESSLSEKSNFRADLNSLSAGVNYIHLFKEGRVSNLSMKSGLSHLDKSSGNFGVGGFFITNHQSADSSIVSDMHFQDNALINRFNGTGLGVLGNFSGQLVFPRNFYARLSVSAGVGLMHKKIETDQFNYQSTNPLLYQMDFYGIVGFTSKRIYVNLTVESEFFATGLDRDHNARFGFQMAKLAVGYKLFNQ